MYKRRMKFCLSLITYTILLVALLIKLDSVLSAVGQVFLLLSPLFVGAFLAFILKRPYDYIVSLFKRVVPKKLEKLSVVLGLLAVYAMFFGIISAVISFIVPQLAESSVMFKDLVKQHAPELTMWIQAAQNDLSAFGIDLTQYITTLEKLPDMLGQFLIGAMPQLYSVTNSVVCSIVNIIMGLVLSVYLLLCREKLAGRCKLILRILLKPAAYKRVLHISSVTNSTFTSFVSGQLTEAFILGGLCFVGMTFLGLEYSLLISVMIGVTSLIPIVGAFIGAAPAAFILFIISPKKAFVFIVFLLALQQFEGNVIYPKVVGGSLGLPAVWILLAITVGGGMFGIVGMLLAVPITSVLYQLIGEEIDLRAAALDKKALAPDEKPNGDLPDA